jgi:hypothetical protein
MDDLVSESIDTKTHIQTTLIWLDILRFCLRINHPAELMRTRAVSVHITFNFRLLQHSYLRPDNTTSAVTWQTNHTIAERGAYTENVTGLMTSINHVQTWLVGVTLTCTSDLTMWQAAFTLCIPESWNLGLATCSSVFVVLFRYLFINSGIPAYPKIAKKASRQFIAKYVHNKPVIRRCTTRIWQIRWNK